MKKKSDLNEIDFIIQNDEHYRHIKECKVCHFCDGPQFCELHKNTCSLNKKYKRRNRRNWKFYREFQYKD